MTKQGKGIALLLVVRKTPIYVDLHPQRTGRPAKMLNPSSYLRGHSQRSLSKYSAFFPPDNTSANKLHQSKNISYHQGEREQSVSTWNQASSQELTAWNPLPDYLPDIALEYPSSTSYTSREDTTSA
ncbi:hypothetical protein ACFX1Q_030006 [Malus domestica]